MDPRMMPKGSATEYNHDGQGGQARPNEPGVYFHPQAGKFIETTGIRKPDGSITYAREAGKIQGDAFAQIGYRAANGEEAEAYHQAQKAAATVQRIRESRTTTVLSSASRK
jgi:hypothetical protein